MANGFRLSAPSEYRRGVILGLTLAEVMILLAFLLLLAMTSLLLRKEREKVEIRRQRDQYAVVVQQVTRTLTRRGIAVDDDRLANLLRDGEAADGLRSRLREVQARADAAQAEAASAREAAAAAAAAMQENQTLVAALDRLAGGRSGRDSGSASEKLAKLAQQLEQADRREADFKRATQQLGRADADKVDLVGQNNQMRVELARVKGNGGSGLPYCWTLPDGRAQYMLKVEMRDDGVLVHDIEPRARPLDAIWTTLDSVPRDATMPIAAFMTYVGPLQAKATSDRCRYSIEVVDATGRTNKPGYKQLMGRLWTAFNIHEVQR